MKKGAIQNEELIVEAAYRERSFVIVCEDEKDANSKRVSMFNARARLSPDEQKKVQIRKLKLDDGRFAVKVEPMKRSIMEIVDGKLVEYKDLRPLRPENVVMLQDMIRNSLSEDEAVEILIQRGEAEESIREEFAKQVKG